MLNVNVVCVGKLKEKYWKSAIEEYTKRLGAFCKFSIIEVDEEKTTDAPNDSMIEIILQKEGERILKKTDKNAYVAAMRIEGKILSSPELSQLMSGAAVDGKSNITFIIGGSWGLSPQVKQRADFKLSMSKMTFPHQLARVMLCEQIYRGFQISAGGKYHK